MTAQSAVVRQHIAGRDAAVATATRALEAVALHLGSGTDAAPAAASVSRAAAAGHRIADILPTATPASPADAADLRAHAVHYLTQAHTLTVGRISAADHPSATEARAEIDARLKRAADLLERVDTDALILFRLRVATIPDQPTRDPMLVPVLVVLAAVLILALLVGLVRWTTGDDHALTTVTTWSLT